MRFSVNHLCAGYGNQTILQDISFSVHEPSLIGVLGANACGKTTLLKSVCCILPHSGECTLDGKTLEKLSLKERAGLISWIPQQPQIDESLTVLDVVLMGYTPVLSLFEQPNEVMRQAALQLLTTVGLADSAHLLYGCLSDGQKQLCVWARTLLTQGKVLLLDEPESALDFHNRREMLKLVQTWIQHGDRCAIAVLHDPQLALSCCDRILLLRNHKLIGELFPKTDSLIQMNTYLSQIYPGCTVSEIIDAKQQKYRILLDEQE